MDTPAVAQASLLEALERLIATLHSQAAPALIGDLARLQALVWVRLSQPTHCEADRRDTQRRDLTDPQGPLWMSVDAVTQQFGLSKHWLDDHRRDLQRRHIIAKPSRKTTLYHARRLARFLEERSRP
jgi:hypothetical protein